MLFNSYDFIFLFFPVAFIGCWWLAKRKAAQQMWLLAANAVFYLTVGLPQFVLLISISLVTFLAAKYLLKADNPRRRVVGLLLGLSSLLILLGFKFAPTFGASSASLLGSALPLGISFYTFNLIGYTLDVYRGRIEPAASLIQFLTYITFFPTLTSGPLVRYDNFAGQEQTERSLRETSLSVGILTFTIGLAKKLIVADRLAVVANILFARTADLGLLGAWTAALAYTYQLYFDFSGYTDMAIGIGHLLGFQLPRNFDAPYAAFSITDFWQRWHITLSTWFREYFFFPLSRILIKRNNSQHVDLIRSLTLVATMALIGLWHGVAWTFLLWGIYHGILLAIHAQIRKPRRPRWQSWIGRVLTFLLVVIGWVLFRSPSLHAAGDLYAAMLGARGLGRSDLDISGFSAIIFMLILAVLFLLTNLPQDTAQLRPRSSYLYAAGVAVMLVICLMLLNQSNPFLYFQF